MSENKNVLNVDTKKSDLSPDDKHMLKEHVLEIMAAF